MIEKISEKRIDKVRKNRITRKTRITWIVPHFPPHIGGGEKLYMDICSELVKNGYEVRVVTSSSGGVTGHHKVNGIDVFYCEWHMMFGHPIVKISDIIPHVKWCDIVHTTIYSTAIKSCIAAKFYKKKCVTTIHEVMGRKWFLFESNPVKAFLFMMYESLILLFCSNVHVVSNATRRDYENHVFGGRINRFLNKRDNNHVYMIYNYLDDNYMENNSAASSDMTLNSNDNISAFRYLFKLEENQRGILFFGRPAKNKGIFVLLKAVKILSSKGLLDDRIKFCMILSSEPANDYKRALEKINEYDISEYIRIRPSLPREELLNVLSGADLVVIPSITEGFGYAAAEACFYDRLIISSDGGSLKEVVSGDCLFFKNRNSVDLARKIYLFIISGTKRFQHVEKKYFRREDTVSRYLEMYENLL